jgi:transcriptional regulator with XRE-family HTH domain
MVLTRLAETLKLKSITAEELAAKSLMSVRSVENAKRGRGVSLTTSKRIALSLKMQLEDLI